LRQKFLRQSEGACRQRPAAVPQLLRQTLARN
jgi:hypothetical protein